LIEMNCQRQKLWHLSQNTDIRNRFVYNPKIGGIYEHVSYMKRYTARAGLGLGGRARVRAGLRVGLIKAVCLVKIKF